MNIVLIHMLTILIWEHIKKSKSWAQILIIFPTVGPLGKREKWTETRSN